MNMRFVAYFRVSTTRQGDSGLGLEAQQEAIRRYLDAVGGCTVAEFVEIESGARNDRQKLRDAIDACRRERATLVIAKLDRLARNVHLISGLMDSGVEFVAVDNPSANRLMLHMLAAFAEHEREQISRRTKEALAAAKARGVALGRFGKTLAKRNRNAADCFALSVLPTLRAVDGDGTLSLRAVATGLNLKGIRTACGVLWHPISVCRLKRRLSQIEQGCTSLTST